MPSDCVNLENFNSIIQYCAFGKYDLDFGETEDEKQLQSTSSLTIYVMNVEQVVRLLVEKVRLKGESHHPFIATLQQTGDAMFSLVGDGQVDFDSRGKPGAACVRQ